MTAKVITVAFYGRNFPLPQWQYPLERQALAEFCAGLAAEYAPFGMVIDWRFEEDMVLEITGYADLLNSVRLRSPQNGIGNLCLGHVIGVSPDRNLFEDIRRGVSRLAFAPETIEPEGSHKVVCHNCGCGC